MCVNNSRLCLASNRTGVSAILCLPWRHPTEKEDSALVYRSTCQQQDAAETCCTQHLSQDIQTHSIQETWQIKHWRRCMVTSDRCDIMLTDCVSGTPCLQGLCELLCFLEKRTKFNMVCNETSAHAYRKLHVSRAEDLKSMYNIQD